MCMGFCLHTHVLTVCNDVCGVQEIAREKAGIFKKSVPAFTVQQPVDALQSLLVSMHFWMPAAYVHSHTPQCSMGDMQVSVGTPS